MKVLVLAGGDSPEREVSLTSGAAIVTALERLGHKVTALDPAGGTALILGDGKLSSQLEAGDLSDTADWIMSPGALIQTINRLLPDPDVVFIALHGGNGENGSIQNLLDLAGMPYTGSGVAASALCMDKALSKHIMVSVGVPTADWRLYRIRSDAEAVAAQAAITTEMDPPFIVKVNDGGSTLGLTRVNDSGGIESALTATLKYSGDVLVEKYISGRELTVSVVDGRAFPLVEIKPQNGLYDYEAKYTLGKSEYIAPAEVDPMVATAMQRAAVKLYDTIGCRGLARVDFIMTEEQDFYCLELNTLPGMTELSLAPMALKCEGLGFDQLVEMIIESALKN